MASLNLTLRQRKLLHTIQNRKDMITGQELAGLLNASARTIRSDVVMINHELKPYGASIESIRSKGYFFTAEDPDSIRKLNRIETITGHNDISFEQDELKRRQLLSELYMEHWNYDGRGNAVYGMSYLNPDLLDRVIDMIPVHLDRHGIRMDDAAIVELNLACTILYRRICSGHLLPDAEPLSRSDPQADRACEELLNALEEELSFTIPPNERDRIYLLIASGHMMDPDRLSFETVQEEFSPDVIGMADAYIEGIGWLTFDPTPGFRRTPGWLVIEREQNTDGTAVTYMGTDDEEEEEETETASDVISDLQNPAAKDRTRLPLLLAALFLVLYLPADYLIRKIRFRRMSAREKARSLCSRCLRILRRLGYRPQPGETLSEFAAKASETVPAEYLGFLGAYEEILYRERAVTDKDIALFETNASQLLQFWLKRLFRRREKPDETEIPEEKGTDSPENIG